MDTTALTAEQVQAMISRGPFHQWLGLEVLRVGEGEIDIRATWREEWVVNPDRRYTHGGIGNAGCCFTGSRTAARRYRYYHSCGQGSGYDADGYQCLERSRGYGGRQSLRRAGNTGLKTPQISRIPRINSRRPAHQLDVRSAAIREIRKNR